MVTKSETEFVLKMMRFIAKHDLFEEFGWNSQLEFEVLCNDVFWWATSDCVPVTESSFKLLKECVAEAEIYGPLLYCSKIKKVRPQGAMYNSIPREYWDLFDGCGPIRQTGLMNPKEQPAKRKEK